jgi:hypothetical protein
VLHPLHQGPCAVELLGRSTDDIKLAFFCDPDFAGDKNHSKSTSSVIVCIAGPATFFPTVTFSKKQGCVSTSTRESDTLLCPLASERPLT